MLVESLSITPSSLSYSDFCDAIDMLVLGDDAVSENVSGRIKSRVVHLFKAEWADLRNAVERIMYHLKMTKNHLASLLNARTIYDVFACVGFSLTHLAMVFKEGSELLANGLQDAFKELADTKEVEKLQSKAIKMDDLLARHPILKQITGPVVGSLMLVMWTEMTFIGAFSYDFDFSDVTDAFAGNYNLENLLLSAKGLMFVSLFATGQLFTIPWMGDSTSNMLMGIVYTYFKQCGNEEIVMPIKMMMLGASEAE